ncbi:MAG: PEP-CTERM sorting domain-containing protein [Pirellulales bacterium]|nr:PEP-CTERM sorting domain-containing protein [Pirellulales bacterium]
MNRTFFAFSLALWGASWACFVQTGRAGTFTLDPDNYAPQTDLRTIDPNVTLRVIVNETFPTPFAVTANPDENNSTSPHVFGHANVPFWNENRRLEMNFNAPTTNVQIDFIGASIFSDYIGQLDVYSGPTLLFSYQTPPLGDNEIRTLTAYRAGGDITRAVAYTPVNGNSPFMRLDHLVYSTVPEPSTWCLGVLGLGGMLAFAWNRTAKPQSRSVKPQRH